MWLKELIQEKISQLYKWTNATFASVLRDYHADLIFVTNITNIISGEKIIMWRNFSFLYMIIVGKLKISPRVEKFQMSPHDRCGEIWNSQHMACVWCKKRRHIWKIYKKNCHNLRAFMWRKIEPKSTFVEKKMTNMRSAIMSRKGAETWTF